MKLRSCYLILFYFSQIAWGQHFRILPLETNFRDVAFFSDSCFAPVFPISTNSSPVYDLLREDKKRYANFGYFLYQREIIQLVKKEGALWISPILDMQLGVQRGDSAQKQFMNVRGVRIEGSMKNKLFFSGAFYENQTILPSYVQEYVSNRGEFYPNMSDSSYYQVNAVIPGAARTKPFKTNGYDYAYATGLLHWEVLKKLSVAVGNTPFFVGSGYRSLLLSDNSLPSMHFRVQYRLGEKWDFQIARMQGINMLRIPYATNGEAMYERKAFSLASIYYHITEKLKIGLVEGAAWSRGDSIQKKPVEGAFYIPLPGAATLQEGINQKSYAYLGLDFNWRFWKMQAYGQYGRNIYSSNSDVAQIGFRYWPFKSHFYLIQAEYNHTSKNAYLAQNPRIHYSSYNLPIAHPMAGGVDELILRVRAEWKHLFISSSTNIYLNQNSSRRQLLPVYELNNGVNQRVFYQNLEIGYSFNRSYGLEVLASFKFRSLENVFGETQYYWINFGIRTAINNHYFDL